MKRIDELFNVFYGTDLELINCEKEKFGIPFISRTSNNNGMVTRIKIIDDIEPMPAYAITVALGGSVLSSFFQKEKFYTSFHIACLYPKQELSEIEMIFYCKVIEENKYRYNYGRQANKTLRNLYIPAIEDIPTYLKKYKTVIPFEKNPITKKSNKFSNIEWKAFPINELFEVKYGVNLELYNLKLDKTGIPFVSRTANNNGISAYVEEIEGINPNPANTISVSGGGSVLECFLQEKPYYSGRDLYYLKPKFDSNKYHLLFIATVLEKEKYRFNYGRQANKTLSSLKIHLPIKVNNVIDWNYMEQFIKSLDYSKCL